jgi:hypothetical protein
MNTIDQNNNTTTLELPAPQADATSNKCVLYVRTATRPQEDSLAEQLQRAAEFAKLKGIIIVETFTDHGVSALTPLRKRPAAKRMFDYIKQAGIQTILVLRLDRVFRSSLDFSRTTTEGLKQGFHFRFISPDIDYGSPMGRMFAGMEAARAEMESAMKPQNGISADDIQRIHAMQQQGMTLEAIAAAMNAVPKLPG